MSQTKKQSLIEAITNTAVGFIISLLSISIILPIMGFESTTGQNLTLTVYFTFISIARGYILRRIFNKPRKNMNTDVLEEQADQLRKHAISLQSEKLPNITLEQAIAKSKPNLDKITDVDKYLDNIR